MILKGNTNRLVLDAWIPSENGTGTLRFQWDLIKHTYFKAYPALFYSVSNQDLIEIDVVLKHEPVDITLVNLKHVPDPVTLTLVTVGIPSFLNRSSDKKLRLGS